MTDVATEQAGKSAAGVMAGRSENIGTSGMRPRTSRAGGQWGLRGYLIQTLIALLDALDGDRAWDTVRLEPSDLDSDKIDLLWQHGGTTWAVQVKSSEKQISLAQAKGWAKELEEHHGGADELELVLVGPCAESVVKLGCVGRVMIPPPKSPDFRGLLREAAECLARFLEKRDASAVRANQREVLVHALMGRLATLSAEGQTLGREELGQLLVQWMQPQYTAEPGTGELGTDGVEASRDDKRTTKKEIVAYLSAPLTFPPLSERARRLLELLTEYPDTGLHVPERGRFPPIIETRICELWDENEVAWLEVLDMVSFEDCLPAANYRFIRITNRGRAYLAQAAAVGAKERHLPPVASQQIEAVEQVTGQLKELLLRPGMMTPQDEHQAAKLFDDLKLAPGKFPRHEALGQAIRDFANAAGRVLDSKQRYENPREDQADVVVQFRNLLRACDEARGGPTAGASGA